MAKRRILYIITKSIWGGATKYTADLAAALPRDQFEVFAAAGPVPAKHSGRDLFSELRDKSVGLFEIKNFQKSVNPLKDVFAFFEIIRLIRKIRPDIIHTSSSKAGGLAGLAIFFLRLLRPPSTSDYPLVAIFTAHGWAYHENRPPGQKFLLKLASRATAAFYDKIICVSEYDRRSAVENKIAATGKLIAIHNGISVNEPLLERNGARHELLPHITTNDFLVGTIGEFTKNKGYDILIGAAAIIIKRHPDTKFVLLGHHGEEKENLKSKILNLKLENSVYLTDNPSNARAYLAAFDLLAMPSLKEGLPYVILEAGAAGLPVVASNVGGIPEIIVDGKEGLLVPAGNAATLEDAVEKMIVDENLRHACGEALYKKIVQKFSFTKMLKETTAIYDKQPTKNNN